MYCNFVDFIGLSSSCRGEGKKGDTDPRFSLFKKERDPCTDVGFVNLKMISCSMIDRRQRS